MNRWAEAGRLIGVGWYISACIILGLLGGRWLDGKLDTNIIFTLVGVFLGLAVAVIGTYRMVAPLLKGQQEKGKDRS